MKKKINKMMILIATVTILLTMVLITIVYYDLFRRQVLEDLKSYGSLLKSCSSVEEIKENGVPVESDLRLTLIGSDGQVLYDNEADSVAMGNHASRPEIQEAMRDGEGEAVRNSETLSQSTFYYAIRLEDGSILRLSKDARSIYSIFSQALPMMVGIFVVLLVLGQFGSVGLAGNSYPGPLYLLAASLAGWMLVYEGAHLLARVPAVSGAFSALGRATMPIVILHFLAFKPVTWLGLLATGGESYLLAAFPIYFTGGAWWVAYTAAGLALPLLAYAVWVRLKKAVRRG